MNAKLRLELLNELETTKQKLQENESATYRRFFAYFFAVIATFCGFYAFAEIIVAIATKGVTLYGVASLSILSLFLVSLWELYHSV